MVDVIRQEIEVAELPGYVISMGMCPSGVKVDDRIRLHGAPNPVPVEEETLESCEDDQAS